MSVEQASVCKSCNTLKPYDQFRFDKNGQPYPSCQLCFHQANALFWSTKQFKWCRGCDLDRPLRKFDYVNGSPHVKCRKCWESSVATRRAAERAQARADSEGVTRAGSPTTSNARMVSSKRKHEESQAQAAEQAAPKWTYNKRPYNNQF